MLADGDLRHKLRFEDQRYAPSTKPSQRRVVVATAAAQPAAFLAQRGLPLLERHSASRPGSASRGFPAMRLAKNEGSGQLKAAAPGKNPPPWPCGQLRWCPALWQVGPWWPASGFPKSAD